jgi:hypothetical protein
MKLKGIKMFRMISTTKRWPRSLVFISLLFAFSYDEAIPSEKYTIPEFGPIVRANGSDVDPYQITSEQIKEFLNEVKDGNTASIMSLGHSVFRIHGKLPDDYKALLSDHFAREFAMEIGGIERGLVYQIDVSQGYVLHLLTDADRGVVHSMGTSYSSGGPDVKITPKPISDTEALGLLRNYVKTHKAEYLPVQDYIFGTARFGKRTRFLYLKTFELSHPDIHEFIMDNVYGGISKKDLKSIGWTCRREFPKSDDPLLHKTIIETFLRLHDEDQRIISGTEDIPGYDKAKLDLDLENTVWPMFSFVSRRRHAKVDTLVYVAYTYQRNNGIVRRYRFPFKNKEYLFETPTYVRLAQHIGEAYYFIPRGPLILRNAK